MKDRIERAIDVANMIDAGPSERIIMLALIVRAGDSLKATMSHAEMSDWCGLTTRTVLTAMRGLIDSGAINPTSEKRARRGAPNTYELVFLRESYTLAFQKVFQQNFQQNPVASAPEAGDPPCGCSGPCGRADCCERCADSFAPSAPTAGTPGLSGSPCPSCGRPDSGGLCSGCENPSDGGLDL